jgi:hypothetical protein
MRLVLAAVLLAVPAAAQVTPFSKLAEYLGLRQDQVDNILKNIQEASRPDPAKIEELRRLQREIAEETVKPSPSAIELGQRYLQIEMICRELRDRSSNIGKENLALLDEAQRARLKQLEGQLPLMQVLSEAMAARLLSPPVNPNPNPMPMPAAGNRVVMQGMAGGGMPMRFESSISAMPMIGGFGCPVPMNFVREPMPMPGPGRQGMVGR